MTSLPLLLLLPLLPLPATAAVFQSGSRCVKKQMETQTEQRGWGGCGDGGGGGGGGSKGQRHIRETSQLPPTPRHHAQATVGGGGDGGDAEAWNSLERRPK